MKDKDSPINYIDKKCEEYLLKALEANDKKDFKKADYYTDQVQGMLIAKSIIKENSNKKTN